MALTILPVDSVDPAYSVDVDLSGTVYRLSLSWNTRGAYWAAAIGYPDGTMFAQGHALRAGWELFRQVVDARMPAGRILVIDNSGANLDPTVDDLGTRVQVVYDDGE